MSAIKRRAVTDERPSKKSKVSHSEPSSKTAKHSSDRKSSDSKRSNAIQSILQQEERSFPRGGASVLTPLEHKQIKADAERDALFEAQGEQSGAIDEENDAPLFDNDHARGGSKKPKSRRGSAGKSEKHGRTGAKVQGLSYKNLVVGSLVLGQVTAITSKDLALALPNNLTGFVPITAVSQRLNQRIEKMLAEEDEAEAANDEDAGEVDLKKIFYTGQWLRAVVTATGSEMASISSKSKRHIELSVDPDQVNGNLSVENMVPNSTLQAAVRSVEDHGLVMDVGLSSATTKGFVSKKELGHAYSLDDVEEGQVFLCLVTGKGSDGKVVKLSPDPARFSALLPKVDGKGAPVLTEAPTVEAFLPGNAVDMLITDAGSGGVSGKIMGMLDATAEVVHSGASTIEDLDKRYKVGSKVKARLLWRLPTNDGGTGVIGVSLLEHMLALPPPSSKVPDVASSKLKSQAKDMEQSLPLSSIVTDAKVTHVLADRGLFLRLPSVDGTPGRLCFAHISQLSDKRIDTLSSTTGPYKIGSLHKARVMSYNPLDGIYYLALKQSILDQAFLRVEDLVVGEVVKGTVDRLLLGGGKSNTGITGVLVKLSDSVTGLVPEMHLSDAPLQHPEKKFREGFPVKARILSVDTEKKHVRLTLKKTLVTDDDLPIWESYGDLKPKMECKGTIINTLQNGAVVQFFGEVRAWLPVAEMSEAYIQDPRKHFRLGQTVSVHIVSVDAETHEMKVSCKSADDIAPEMQKAWEETEGGHVVSGKVMQKTADAVVVELENGIQGLVHAAHLVDGSSSKAESALRRIRVGQKLSKLLVLSKQERSRQVLLTHKPSMLEDAKSGAIVQSFKDAQEGKRVHGFVRNVTPEGVYVEFTNGFVSLVPKSQLAAEMLGQPAFGLRTNQTISAWVLSIDKTRERFTLSMRPQKDTGTSVVESAPSATASEDVQNPVDSSIKSLADFALDKVVKAKIVSIKGTQINVRLADNIQGRIDVSEAFETWEDIKSKKSPLQKFKQGSVLEVRVLGIHDAKSHRFLPISHRQSRVLVFELSAKPSRVQHGDRSLLEMSDVKIGQESLAFVNNHGDNCVWVNLSPNVRGRIALMDLSDDAGSLQDLERHFPIGSALRVRIKSVDVASHHLDLTARVSADEEPLTLQAISSGMVLPARVTKVTDRAVNVQLSDTLAAPVPLVELSDDYDQVDPYRYSKNDIVRACVLGVDLPNKKLYLTLRPSKVLSSSMPIQDRSITDIKQLSAGEIVRGFVKHVGEKGVLVALGAKVDAFVRIADLSDQYVKDWKSLVEVDRLVKARILSVDAASNHIQLSLKASHVDADYKPPLSINDLEKGTIVTGKVRKVEDFGAFIDIDNTAPRLSGLCHRSEVAAKRVEDVRKLYSEGDVVKAIVLNVDVKARKISLGLKASYFEDVEGEDEEAEVDSNSSEDGIEVDGDGDGSDMEVDDVITNGGVDLEDMSDVESGSDAASDAASEMEVDGGAAIEAAGLKTNGFDWTGESLEQQANDGASNSEAEAVVPKKRKRNKPVIKEDMTGDLDKYGPQSVSDFERQLLGEPNNSDLWLAYMAFQLRLGEVQKARDIAERAIRTIHIRELDEKARIWIARLNLEVEYGDEEMVEEVFKQACQVQEPLDMHERLASIYLNAGKHDKADAMFERIVANKNFRASPEVWFNYATFLMTTMNQPVRARALLPRALKSIPTNEHRPLTARFAALEFRSPSGDDERGRTVFEGLVTEWPNWTTGWDQWIDLEKAKVAKAESESDKTEAIEKVRALYERIVRQKMKPRRAKFVFGKWLEFEDKFGTKKSVEKARTAVEDWTTKAREAKEAAEQDEEA